jgi:TPR repeat protein
MEHHQMKIKHLIMIILSITLAVIPVYADDYQEGMDAFGRKDIKTALKKFKPLAEKGHLKAQTRLGWMYKNGKGVPQDYKEAAKWYQLAGEQGDSVSQIILGAMYEKGKGISKDFVEAYKWFSISGETGNGRMYIEKLGKRKMTTAQIAEGQKLAQEWMEKHQKK